MSPPFVYCVVCGCPFEIPPADEYEYADSEDERWATTDPSEDITKQWLCNIRLIGSTAYLQRHYPGDEINNESDIEGVFISGPASWSFTEGCDFRTQDQNVASFRVLSLDKVTGDALFPLHDGCLSILRHAISWRVEFARQPASPSLSLMGVYKFFCSQRKRDLAEMYRIADQGGINSTSDYASCGLEFDHGYYGARKFWTYQGWEVSAANEWFCSDPVNVPELPDFISASLSRISSEPAHAQEIDRESLEDRANPRMENVAAGAGIGLQDLPLEVLNRVTSFLSASDVVRLRRCSKVLSRSIVLDKHFWRMQILSGGVIPYLYRIGDCGRVLDANATQADSQQTVPGHWDWEGLARSLRDVGDFIQAEEPSLASSPWGFRNRCRIWAIVNYLISASLE